MIVVGDKAPDFILSDQNEKEHTLEEFLGKWVVLYFYPKDNTKGCTLESINFSNNVEKFSRLNAEIIGVSPDSTSSHKRFEQKQNLRVILLSNPDHGVLEKYGVWQLKKLYGREYFGVNRSTFIIDPEGNVAHVWLKVRVSGHVDEVLGKIRDLQD